MKLSLTTKKCHSQVLKMEKMQKNTQGSSLLNTYKLRFVCKVCLSSRRCVCVCARVHVRVWVWVWVWIACMLIR